MRNARVFFLVLSAVLTVVGCKKDDPQPNPSLAWEVPAAEDLVFYEVNVRAFGANGDLTGVRQKLDHIASLGVNAIWLMPIHPIGTINSVNSPYSVRDYTAVGSEYGTLEDLQALVDEAHDRGIVVVLDWVANHTAWDHPWIANADWYTQDANGNIIHPAGTNWQDVADLNFSSGPMRQAMIESMRYWVDNADIDGFRCDAADWVPNSFWEQAISSLRAGTERPLIFLAEGADAGLLPAGFDVNFGWNWYDGIKSVYNGTSATTLAGIHTTQMNSIPTGKTQLRFTTNHDESAWDATPVSLFGGFDGAFGAQVITTFMGGIPLIYGSQEVGQSQTLPFFSNSPINWTQNPGFLSDYEAMMGIYASHPEARTGVVSDASNSSVVSFVKELNNRQVWVAVNCRNATKTLDVPVGWQEEWADAMTGQLHTSGATREFAPYEWSIWVQEN